MKMYWVNLVEGQNRDETLLCVSMLRWGDGIYFVFSCIRRDMRP
jgi:hypothetical protein